MQPLMCLSVYRPFLSEVGGGDVSGVAWGAMSERCKDDVSFWGDERRSILVHTGHQKIIANKKQEIGGQYLAGTCLGQENR